MLCYTHFTLALRMIAIVKVMSVNQNSIALASNILLEGGVVCIPTDTVYGLGCSIYNKKAMQRLYQIKKMNLKKPLTFVCANQTEIQEYSN